MNLCQPIKEDLKELWILWRQAAMPLEIILISEVVVQTLYMSPQGI